MMTFNPLFLNNSATPEAAMNADVQKANKNGYLFSDIIKVMMNGESMEEGAALPIQQATLTDKVEKNVVAGMPVKLIGQVNLAPDNKLAEEILTDLKQLIAKQGKTEEVVKGIKQLALLLNAEQGDAAKGELKEVVVNEDSLKALLNKITAKVKKHIQASDTGTAKGSPVKIDVEKLEKLLQDGEEVVFTIPGADKQLTIAVSKADNNEGFVVQVAENKLSETTPSLIERLVNTKNEASKTKNTFTVTATDKKSEEKIVHDFANGKPKKEVVIADNSSGTKEKTLLSPQEVTETYTGKTEGETAVQDKAAGETKAAEQEVQATGKANAEPAKEAATETAKTTEAKAAPETVPQSEVKENPAAKEQTAADKAAPQVDAKQTAAKEQTIIPEQKVEAAKQTTQQPAQSGKESAAAKVEAETPTAAKPESTKTEKAAMPVAEVKQTEAKEKVAAEQKVESKAEVNTKESAPLKERIREAFGTNEKTAAETKTAEAKQTAQPKAAVDTKTESKIIDDIKSGSIKVENTKAKAKTEVKTPEAPRAEMPKAETSKIDVPKTEAAKVELPKSPVQPEEPKLKASVKDEVKQPEVKAAPEKEVLKEAKPDTPKVDKEFPLAKETKEVKETADKHVKPELVTDEKQAVQKEESKSINIKVNKAIKSVNVSKGEQQPAHDVKSVKEEAKPNVKADESDVKVKADAETAKPVEAAADKQKSEFTFEKEDKSTFAHTNKTNGVTAKEKASFEMPQQTSTNERVVRTSEIMKEIAKHIQRYDKNTLSLRIDPEHLGKLKLTIDVVDNMVKANVEVESTAVKHVVESNLSTLNQDLAKNGIQLSSINISLSDQDAKQSKQFANNKKKSSSSFEKDDDSIHEQEEVKAKQLGYNTYEYLV